MSKPTIAVGVLIFNPFDDEFHLARIEACLSSLLKAARAATSVNVRLLFVPNLSEPLSQKIPGTGPATLTLVRELAAREPSMVEVRPHLYRDSMNVKGYNFILKSLFDESQADYISVFADDYIVPRSWFDLVHREMSQNAAIDFLTPSTSFVAQANLLVPFEIKNEWRLNAEGNVIFGVTSGVTIDDVEKISSSCQSYPNIRFLPPPSFETTVFRRSFLEKHGFLHDEYYSLFYNTEYFDRAVANGAQGLISRRAFVFHFGKGATKALFKEGDEKFSASPAEKYLLRDIEIYNQRNGKDIQPWWTSGNPVRVGKPSNAKIRLLMKKYELMSLLKRYPRVFAFAKTAYRSVKKAGA